ncbi:MAG: ABC transporter ATP-binding protein [Alphaproteobacteria bacterium]
MTAVLQVDALDGGYGKLTVFRDVSLAVSRDETLGLLGANGAGKTTLLKTIAGALPPTKGRVLLDGRDVTRMPAYLRARAGIGLVPEGRHILATLSVRDNLALTRAIEAHRPDLPPFEQRIAEVYAMFPRLAERASQLGGSLSGGEQQMLAIARALLLKPRVLMLDEPTQGLAPIIVQSLAVTLAGLKGRFAMIVVEQNKAFLEQLADSILQVRSGALVAAEGRPATDK